MSFALNEVEATAKKATRGAGYSWGMSEEAAKATRWLCANGIDGVKALATVLVAADGSDPAKMSPTMLADMLADEWHSHSGVMCPLMAGATLADFAGVGAANTVTISNVIAPVLLLPFAAMAARQLGTGVMVKWDGVMASTDGGALYLEAATDLITTDMTTDALTQVTLRRAALIGHPVAPLSRATPTDSDWATLNQFAHRTYAPATEDSRLKGAGAGLSDND